MTEQMEIYECEVCGNLIEVLRPGVGELVCCGEPMNRLETKTEDQGYEKHVPVIEKTDDGVLVKVGANPHPMEEEHHIEWIEIVYDGKCQRKFLKAGDQPQAEFCVSAETVEAREHCNVHGLWWGE